MTLRFLQEKAENDKENARLKVALGELQRRLFEKEEEANFHKKRQEETLKKAPAMLNSQHIEDENKFLQQEKKNLEGKIMQLLNENERMKRKFDDVLQENAVPITKNLDRSPTPKKNEPTIVILLMNCLIN